MPFSTPRPAPYIDIDGELEAGLVNRVQIDELLDGGDVGRLEIGARQRLPPVRSMAAAIEFAFDRLA